MLDIIPNKNLKPVTHRLSIKNQLLTVLTIIVFSLQLSNASERHKAPVKKHYKVSYPKVKLTAINIIDTNNNSVKLTTELNKGPVVVNFIFTSCTAICPILSSTFSQVQQRFDEIKVKDIRLVSFSIDPERDTPARLKEYAKKFSAGGRWKFFTGNVDDMLSVENIFGNYRGNKMNHLPYTFIRINKNSKWIRLKGFVSASSIINEINTAN